MLIHVYNNGGVVSWAGSDPGTPAALDNYHLCLTGVGRIVALAYPTWEILNAYLCV